jgi:hypothetical protein
MPESFLNKVREAYPKQATDQTPAPARPWAGGDLAPYAQEALSRETLNVATAPEGTRNDTLNIAAVKLGALAAGGHLPAALIVQELTSAAKQAGLDDLEIRKTLNSGLRKGEEAPREIPDRDKELDLWLNTLSTAPAHRAESANGSTPSQPPTQGGPGAENATQSSASTSTTSAPWETDDSLDGWTTGAPSSSSSADQNGTGQTPPLPWENPAPPAGTPSSDPHGITAVPAELLTRETAVEYLKLAARENAARLLKQQHTNVQAPPTWNLTEFLKLPDDPADFRIFDLLPAGGRVILSAQYKAGKSSMVGNLARSLADGTPFLDTYAVKPVTKVTIIDNELSQGQIRKWYRELEIQNTDAVDLIPLRGAASSFDILDPVVRAQWAARLAGTEFLILDCLRPVMDALGLSEDKDAGKFLAAFDALIAECGAAEAVIVHHMGHGGNRSRGDSRILDWPDATWTMKREDHEDPKSPRYFEALGRDVNVDEALLEWTEEGRTLKIVGGSRKQAKLEAVIPEVLELVRMHPGVSGKSIEEMRVGDARITRAALAHLVASGELKKIKRTARGGGYMYQTGP